MSWSVAITTGSCYAAKEEGRGVYVAIDKTWKGQWRCLVLIPDFHNDHEPAGSLSHINPDWLLFECRRVA